MGWLAENVSTDLYVHIMEQHRPDAHIGKENGLLDECVLVRKGKKTTEETRYAEINRAVRDEELASRDAAVKAGLWRFGKGNDNNSAFHL